MQNCPNITSLGFRYLSLSKSLPVTFKFDQIENLMDDQLLESLAVSIFFINNKILTFDYDKGVRIDNIYRFIKTSNFSISLE